MKSIPDQPVREHIQSMYEPIIKNKLKDTFRRRMIPVMERIITEYITGLINENSIDYSYDELITVSFGKELKYEFKCASQRQIDLFEKKKRWDFTDYVPLLRAYSLYVSSLFMLSNFISQTLLQMDEKVLRALQARNKFAKAKRG